MNRHALRYGARPGAAGHASLRRDERGAIMSLRSSPLAVGGIGLALFLVVLLDGNKFRRAIRGSLRVLQPVASLHLRAKRNLRWQVTWQVLAFEINCHVSLVPKLLAEYLHDGNWPQIVQFRRA
jgi:hypothetical protein